MYKKYNLKGGHIILLNPVNTKEYEADVAQAKLALAAYPGGLQIGGGMNSENAKAFLEYGASHIIVTSYVFSNGCINFENLKKMVRAVGKEHLVLDLSCRKRDGAYYIVTDRWQKFTNEVVTKELMEQLAAYCSEFLVHAVDVEGKASGIEGELAGVLGAWGKIPITYAGGISTLEDIQLLQRLGCDKLDYTIGSALDIFGGNLPFEQIVNI